MAFIKLKIGANYITTLKTVINVKKTTSTSFKKGKRRKIQLLGK